MSNTPHELAEEFPADIARIHEKKVSDAHFARLVEEYTEVNRAVHRAETLIEPVTPEHEATLRKQRMALKDEIGRQLRAA